MSHITVNEAETADQQITSLEALARAADRCGLRLNRDQKEFRVYGSRKAPSVHALVKPDARNYEYEIGVVESKKFPGTLNLSYDYDAFTTQSMNKLRMFYQMETARDVAQINGDIYSEVALDDGSYKVTVDTSVRLGV